MVYAEFRNLKFYAPFNDRTPMGRNLVEISKNERNLVEISKTRAE